MNHGLEFSRTPDSLSKAGSQAIDESGCDGTLSSYMSNSSMNYTENSQMKEFEGNQLYEEVSMAERKHYHYLESFIQN